MRRANFRERIELAKLRPFWFWNLCILLIDRRTFYLRINNQIVGFISISRNRISNLFVIQEFRNRSFAQKIMEFAEQYVQQDGYDFYYCVCKPNLLKFHLERGAYVEKYLSPFFRIRKDFEVKE